MEANKVGDVPMVSTTKWLGLQPQLREGAKIDDPEARSVRFEDEMSQEAKEGAADHVTVNFDSNHEQGKVQGSTLPRVVFTTPAPILESLPNQTTRVQRELYKCAQGEHDAVWYKFQRFETLNLLNLYHYQDELVTLEEGFMMSRGQMNDDELQRLRTLMKDYQEALHLFETTSRMKRPAMADRKKTALAMSCILGNPRYMTAPDALGMVDVMPQALGVEADSVRTLLAKTLHKPRLHRTPQHSLGPLIGEKDVEAAGKLEGDMRTPGREQSRPTVLFSGRPYAIPITATIDTLARLAVSILAAIFLLVPMVVLTYIKKDSFRLTATCLFVLSFAVVLSLSSKASNHELMVATATYSAVLVVFVGQTS